MDTTSTHTPSSNNSQPKRTRRRRLTPQKAYEAAEKQLQIARAAREKALDQIQAAKREESERQGERLVTTIVRQMDRSTREAIMAMIVEEATEDQQPQLHAWLATLS